MIVPKGAILPKQSRLELSAMAKTTPRKSPSSTVMTPAAGRVALKSFFLIMEGWGVTSEEAMILLGGVSRTTYFRYKALPEITLGVDTLDRISYIMGIYKGLRMLFNEPDRANQWIKRPNTASPFHGKSALEWMLQGHLTNLAETRRYIDAWRG